MTLLDQPDARHDRYGAGWMPLTEQAVDQISAIPDTSIRNLWITESYADLAAALLDMMGTDQTWCTFAIWASNTAGISIRESELPHALENLLVGVEHHAEAIATHASDHGRVLGWLIQPFRRSHLDRLVRDALDQVSEHIAHGNTLVYRELAPIFVRFIEHIDVDGPPVADDVDVVLDQLGVPSAQQDERVRTAFRHYALAAGTNDSGRRAQHVLAANVAAVLHEQERLQSDVASALDAGLVDVGRELDGLCHRLLPRPIRRLVVRAVRRRVAVHVEQLWEHIATKLLMTMDVPGQTLHLGDDVPAVDGAPLFPEALRQLDLPDLVELMAEWDPTGGTGKGSGAGDWADIHERMGYIVNLFRSRQRLTDLTSPPFTPQQMAAMRRGELPAAL